MSSLSPILIKEHRDCHCLPVQRDMERLFTGPLKILITNHSVYVKYCIGRRSKCMIKKELIENKINLCFYEVIDNVLANNQSYFLLLLSQIIIFSFNILFTLGNLSHYTIKIGMVFIGKYVRLCMLNVCILQYLLIKKIVLVFP